MNSHDICFYSCFSENMKITKFTDEDSNKKQIRIIHVYLRFIRFIFFILFDGRCVDTISYACAYCRTPFYGDVIFFWFSSTRDGSSVKLKTKISGLKLTSLDFRGPFEQNCPKTVAVGRYRRDTNVCYRMFGGSLYPRVTAGRHPAIST